MADQERKPQVILYVDNLERSIRFYTTLPGFYLERLDPGIARIIGPGGVPLLLAVRSEPAPDWQGLPVAGPAAWVYLCHPNLIDLAAELATLGLPGQGPVERYPGYQHLLLEDPDGYWLVFWEPLPLTDEQVESLYRSGSARLNAALAGLAEADLDLPLAPSKWTIRQIVHHFVDAELATFQVIRMALALPGRKITTDVWEPDEWMQGLDCARRPIGPAVQLFHAARDWVSAVLDHLPDGLDRSVTWPSGYQAQVRDLLRQVGGHAVHHLIQIEEIRQRHGR